MEREMRLASVGLAVLTLVVILVAVGGSGGSPDGISVREQTIAAGNVSGGTVTLSVDSRLGHRGGTAENVSVLVRAIDEETGFVTTQGTRAIGSVSGNREVSVVQNLSVPRKGTYEIETVVFADGQRVSSGRTRVTGISALQPDYARTGVEFHRFEGFDTGGLPPIQFSIEGVTDNRTTLNVSTYLTNAGDQPNDQLTVTFLARQVDSNIVADKTVVSVGTIEPGRTTTPAASLTVPDNYNYRLVAIVQKDGVIVATAQSTATLNPSNPVSVETDQGGQDTLETGDFERETPEPAQQRETASGSGPGFTPVAVVVALVVLGLVARHRE